MVPSRIAVAIWCACASFQLPPTSIQTGAPDGREFVLRLTPPVELDRCSVQSYQTGPFGGYGYMLPARSLGPGVFGLRTGLAGKPAETLKVALWCRGYGMVLVNIPALPTSAFEAPVLLTPLAEIPMTGRVSAPADGVSLAGATLRAYYNAYWLCGFFGLPDCMVPTWEVGVDRLGEDGSLSIKLPDFARDPVVGKSNHQGSFTFRAERTSAPFDYRLEQSGRASGSVSVAAAYRDLLLVPRRH